jgi:hypothetical protein
MITHYNALRHRETGLFYLGPATFDILGSLEGAREFGHVWDATRVPKDFDPGPRYAFLQLVFVEVYCRYPQENPIRVAFSVVPV